LQKKNPVAIILIFLPLLPGALVSIPCFQDQKVKISQKF
jgi:hypothetical protein